MKYYLTKNHLSDEDNYIARVITTRTLNQASLINKMLHKRTLISKTDILAVLNSYYETIIQCIKDGYAINLPLYNIHYSIRGVFENSEAVFTKDKHQLHIKFNSGKLLKRVLNEVAILKEVSPMVSIELTQVLDVATNTINTTITSEGLFELEGIRLKVAGTDTAVGLYFVSEDGSEIKVNRFSRNTFKNIIAQAPKLAAGTYTICIKTQATSKPNTFLKEVRTFNAPFILTVF
ncbi:DNA-binding domain-containing protein [uncultured Tenacibaculum sp.]|uniref:HU family DNA-binding protein n=1 Tax=uncultured Tenacibaculum sp. TaxID=174713 RepID=UPI00261BBA27|nr:DNA-binding domain-containing protein [uncultured Tenacibaculum sp.]